MIFIASFFAMQDTIYAGYFSPVDTLQSFFFFFPVYTSLGYKNAVKAWYEIKLQEARLEAQQDAQYLLQGDVCFSCTQQTFWEFLHVFFVLFASY